ncbi:flagellar biosynthetic protein FliO [Castellaniella sp.]|uniref:flagellar biosynthetic protein FliO n=1 Tax=Castellaniella sp. TaxID=1955812 RepID=UPI002AFF090E|nr:flagellar biosynthetic protein FliO [Castellaniella sp.]
MDQAQTLRVIGALLFVLVVIMALAWFARRSGWLRHASKSNPLRILGTHSLGARCSVTVIQVDDTRLVLGVTPQAISILHTLPPPASADTPPSTQDDFATVLSQSTSRP